METTVVNTSKEMMAYSDFPPPAEWANFMHHSKVNEYLHMYAEAFDLKKHIQFNTAVKKVREWINPMVCISDREEGKRMECYSTKWKRGILRQADAVYRASCFSSAAQLERSVYELFLDSIYRSRTVRR